MKLATFALLLMLAIGSSTARADSSLCPLTGIKGFIVAATIEDDASKMGIDKNVTQNKIEERMKKAAIAVSNDKPTAVLNVDVTTIKATGSALVAINVRATVAEVITLPRLGKKSVFVTTWTSSVNALSGTNDVTQVVSDCVDSVMDDFTADYVKDNPKP